MRATSELEGAKRKPRAFISFGAVARSARHALPRYGARAPSAAVHAHASPPASRRQDL